MIRLEFESPILGKKDIAYNGCYSGLSLREIKLLAGSIPVMSAKFGDKYKNAFVGEIIFEN